MDKAKDVLEEPISVSPDEPVKRILSKLAGRRIVVVTEDGYLGVVTPKSLITRGGLDVEGTKVRTVMQNSPVISPETSLPETARLMLESDQLEIPVIKDRKLIGMVTARGIVKAMSGPGSTFAKMKATDVMSSDIVYAALTAMMSDVLREFMDSNISKMPVLEGRRLVGLVTYSDYARKSLFPREKQQTGALIGEKHRLERLPVSNLMDQTIDLVKPEDTLDKVIGIMREAVFVGDTMDDIKGIITLKDLLEPLSEKLAFPHIPLIQVTGEVEFDQEAVSELILDYSQRDPNMLGKGMFTVYVSEHKETFRKERLTYVRLRVRTPAGMYSAYAEGWGAEHAVKNALRKIEKQIDKRLDRDNKTREKEYGEAYEVRES